MERGSNETAAMLSPLEVMSEKSGLSEPLLDRSTAVQPVVGSAVVDKLANSLDDKGAATANSVSDTLALAKELASGRQRAV